MITGQCANISAHTYDENNERAQINVLKLDLQNFCVRSLSSLYRKTHNSTPCDNEENSRDSTFLCRNSIISSGNETVSDCLLRLTMQGQSLQKRLSILIDNSYIVRIALTEGLTNGKHKVFSERAESKGGSNDSSGTERSGTERTNRCDGERFSPFDKGTSPIKAVVA